MMNIQKLLLFLFTFSLTVTQINAKYLDGILRLYQGDGSYADSTGNDQEGLELRPAADQSDAGITLVSDTPYGTESRQVFDFSTKGRAIASTAGLPVGAAHRTIIGWYKSIGESEIGAGVFGYGLLDNDNTLKNTNYYLLYYSMYDDEVYLDQWGQDEGINPVFRMTKNTWYHIAFTWDGTYNHAYVNGGGFAISKSGAPDAPPATIVDPTDGFEAAVAIGGSFIDGRNFRGRVADFAIFDRALTQSEVLEIYNDPNGLEGTPPPTLAPTPKQTPAPTPKPTFANKAEEGEWFIYNAGDATENPISAKEIEISLPFNTSNRDRGANVYESDCVTALSSSDLVTNLHTTTPTSDANDGFIQFNTTFKVDIDAFIETDYVTPLEDGDKGGSVLICVETFLQFNDKLDLGNGIANERVNFKNNVLNISVSLKSDFTVDSVNVEREEVDTENVETDYSELVNAFLCDSSQNEIQQSDITYKQGQRITLCVSDILNDDNNRIVQVEEFNSLVVSQQGNTPYNFIKNSLFNPEITTPGCVDGTGGNRRVCYAEFVALPRFFAKADPTDLTISGTVFVVRDGSRVRRSLRMTLPAPEDNNAENAVAVPGRRAQAEGEEGSGDFEVFASLESTADSAAPGLTTAAAGLVSMVVGAAGETLMV